MGLLPGVRPDVAGLMLEAVEGLLAQRTLVGPGQILAGLVLGGLSILEERSHEAHGSSGHGTLGGGGSGGLLGLLELVVGVVIEYAGEVSKTCGRC